MYCLSVLNAQSRMIQFHQEPMSIEGSMLFSPKSQFAEVSTLTRKSRPEEHIRCIYGRLNTRICRAHDSLSQVIEAVCHMRLPFLPKVERLQLTLVHGRIESSAKRILPPISCCALSSRDTRCSLDSAAGGKRSALKSNRIVNN